VRQSEQSLVTTYLKKRLWSRGVFDGVEVDFVLVGGEAFLVRGAMMWTRDVFAGSRRVGGAVKAGP
jgi:hypothetical protein